MNRLSVVILAGAGDGDSALASGQSTPKALIPLNGRPLIDYVLRALAATGIGLDVAIVGLEPSALSGTPVPCRFFADRRGMIQNLQAGLAAFGPSGHLLVCSCDLPFLSAESITDFLERSAKTGADLCYPIVREDVLERQFPGAGRSYRKIVEGSFAGGDLLWLAPSVVERNARFVQNLAENRKSAWGLVKVMGVKTVLRFLTGRLRVSHLEQRASKLLGCRVAAIETHYPEIAMDIDKPHQLQLAERMLSTAR